LYGSLYFEFGRNHHTCSIVNLLVAHQKMQNGVTFMWVVIVARTGCYKRMGPYYQVAITNQRLRYRLWQLTIRVRNFSV
jgi:hypothetical protein